MSFNAGSIVGDLQLNTAGFTQGLLGAEAISSLVPGWAQAFLVDPLLGVASIAESVGSRILDSIKSAVESTGHTFDNLGESAEKIGVSAGFLDSVGHAAADAGASMDSLGQSIKFLEDRQAAARNGDEEAIASFQKIGISVDDLSGSLRSPEALFNAVADGIAGISDPADKTAVALNLMSRGGTEMLAFLNQGSAGIGEFANQYSSLAGVVSENDTKIGDNFGKLETLFSGALDGIQRAAARPILQYLSDHSEEIISTLTDVTHWLETNIPRAIDVAISAADHLRPVFEGLGTLMKGVLSVTDAVGLTVPGQAGAANGAGAGGAGASVTNNVQVKVGFDPAESADQWAKQVIPEIRRQHETQKLEIGAEGRRQLVAKSMGARA